MITYKDFRRMQENELKAFPCFYAENDEDIQSALIRLEVNDTSELYHTDNAPFYFRARDAEAIQAISAKYDAVLKEAYKDDEFLREAMETEFAEHDYHLGYPADAVCIALGLDYKEVCENDRLTTIWLQALTSYMASHRNPGPNPLYSAALDDAISDDTEQAAKGKKKLVDMTVLDSLYLPTKAFTTIRNFVTPVVNLVTADLKREAATLQSNAMEDLIVRKFYAETRIKSAYKNFKRRYLNPQRYLTGIQLKFEKPLALFHKLKDGLTMLKDPAKAYKEMEPYRMSYETYGKAALKQMRIDSSVKYLIEAVKKEYSIPEDYNGWEIRRLRLFLNEDRRKLTPDKSNDLLVWRDICRHLKEVAEALKEVEVSENERREKRIAELKEKAGTLSIQEKLEFADLIENQLLDEKTAVIEPPKPNIGEPKKEDTEAQKTTDQLEEYERRLNAIKITPLSERVKKGDYIRGMRQSFRKNWNEKNVNYAVLKDAVVDKKWNEKTAKNAFSVVAPEAAFDKTKGELADQTMTAVKKSPEYKAMRKELTK